MTLSPLTPEDPEIQAKMWNVFRDYFDAAEKKRRWNMNEDIPWDQCNPNIDPAIADVIETFCMIELYLPDYVSKQMPQVRNNKGRAWMLASWGYEESKHSMVLNDWMLRGKHRTEKQLTEMDNSVFEREWNLRYNDPLATVVYTMVQEVATRVNYRNLRKIAGGKCPTLDSVLELIQIDEAAHGHFFRSMVSIYLEHDRAATLERIKMVLNGFAMPVDHLLSDGRRRLGAVKSLGIFDEKLFFNEVATPLLNQLGLTRNDLRGPKIHKVT
ncbi:MAG: acyl-ACP desaturase [Planctomycetes bacterium]|nr:acyl-ACP desaturase [Planctomycetota bacterium]